MTKSKVLKALIKGDGFLLLLHNTDEFTLFAVINKPLWSQKCVLLNTEVKCPQFDAVSSADML